MKQDEIIEMAREAGLYQDINVSFHQALRNFYDLAVAKEALAQPEQVIQDRHCSITLRLQGKPYPRTCKKCGLGPCIAQPTAQRTWVDLPDEKIDSFFEDHGWSPSEYYYPVIKDIEAWLKEKNT